MDELNIPLTKRADDKGVIFYEIETENLDKAKETIKKLEDNKFKDVFISHAKVNPDGSTVRLSDAELYNQTGQTSYGYDPKKDAPKTVILDDEQANRLFRENFEIIEETEDAIETAKAKEQREKAEAEAKTEVVSEDPVTETEDSPKTKLQQAGDIGESLLKGSAAVLDAIGGPNAIISYVMGKKGLKAATEEVKPMSRPELSPMFMQHLRQTKELSKRISSFRRNEV